jgi:small-conductance mechanosensitive channel
LLFITALFTIALLLGINYDKFGFILSTIFTLVGVALFAQWSILSNVTASLIIFFFFPYRVGDTIKIQDDSELLEGCIEEITLFHLLIRRTEGDIISYPNSLVFQKAIIIKPRVNNIENDKKQH